MRTSLAILLPLAALLPFTLGVPDPRGRGGGGGGGGRGGGGGGVGSGGSGSVSSGDYALAALGGVIVANANNHYSTDGDPPPNSGYSPGYSCDFDGTNKTNSSAADVAWMGAMTQCLNLMSTDSWAGNECVPQPGGGKYLFWKGEDDYDSGSECYQRCFGCLSSAINASRADTTKCQYEYRTARSIGLIKGYKTHTCTMGYDANS